MIVLRTHHWLFAAVIALMLYVGAAVAMLWQLEPPAATKQVDIGGIEIALGPAGGATGEARADIVEEEVAAEPTPESEPATASGPEPEPEREPEPESAQAPESEQAPEPHPEPGPERVRTPPSLEPVAQKKLFEPQVREPLGQASKPATTALGGTQGKLGTLNKSDRGNGDSTAGGGQPGPTANYMTTLQTWLERHKEYPRRARRRKQEGTALLYFVMDRDGQIKDYRIEKSSGYKLLDREVLAMIERAQPLPRMPDSMTHAQLQLIVPVRFALR